MQERGSPAEISSKEQKIGVAVNFVNALGALYWQYRIPRWKEIKVVDYRPLFIRDRLRYKEAWKKVAESFPGVNVKALKRLASRSAFKFGLWQYSELSENWENPNFAGLRTKAEEIGIGQKEIEVISVGMHEVRRREDSLFRPYSRQ